MVNGILTEFHFGGSVLLCKWSVTGVITCLKPFMKLSRMTDLGDLPSGMILHAYQTGIWSISMGGFG